MRQLLSSILILIWAQVAIAAPSISNVTGTVSSGQTLTISGSNLLNENKTNWRSNITSGTNYGFEGANLAADTSYATGGDNTTDPVYDSSVKLMGSHSLKCRITGAHSGTGGASYVATDGLSRGDLYIRFYTKWHSAGTTSVWPNGHLKMVDMQGSGGSDQMYFQPDADGNLPSYMNVVYEDTPSKNHLYSVNNFYQDNRWYCMEVRWKNTATPNYTAWVDGVQIANISGDLGDLCTMQYILLGMINGADTGSDFDLTEWIDNFALSTSRIYPSTMVEVSNNSTYGSGTVVKQPLTSISDSSVSFVLDTTGLGSGPYYVWVTDNRQARNGTPYQLGSSSPTIRSGGIRSGGIR